MLGFNQRYAVVAFPCQQQILRLNALHATLDNLRTEHTAVSVHVDNSVMEIQVYIFPAHKLRNTTASVTKSRNYYNS